MNAQSAKPETRFIAEGPRPLVRKIDPASPYPVHALGPLRKAVEAVQGQTQAPVAIPAQSALAVTSLAVQGFANVETLGGARPLSLYALTVARSGERKSACDAPFMEALGDHEREQSQVYSVAKQRWSNEHAIWKASHDRIVQNARKAKGGDNAAAVANLQALGPEPAAPPAPDRTVTEPTFEGLTKLFAFGQPSLGLFSDEGGQFLGGHAMNGENRQKTLAAFNDLWQGKPIRRTRSGDGHMTLYERRLAIHLMVQPIVARGFMADPLASDTGFLARFLLCEPRSTIGTRLYEKSQTDGVDISRFAARLRYILSIPMPMDADTRELKPRCLPLSEPARDALAAFYNSVERAQLGGGDMEHVTGTASKAAEQAARIAGVLTLWNDLEAVEVSTGTITNAIDLARFYLFEASRLANAAIVSKEIDLAESLRNWLSDKWQEPEVMVRDVVRLGPNRLRESPTARAALALLEQHGYLIRLEPGTVVRDVARAEAWATVRSQDNDA